MTGKLFIPFILLCILLFYVLSQNPFERRRSKSKNEYISTHTVVRTSEFTPSTPSLEQIFSDNHNWLATLSAERKRVLIATGDIIPARSVNYKVVTLHNFNWPYEKTAEVLKNSDITFINLETPLTHNCPKTQTGMIFCGDQRNVEGLLYAGVDIASLANNHAGNYGASGVEETISLLNQKGILTTGVNGPLIKDVRGIKFAFLGYNDITTPQPGISNVDEEKIKNEIADAKTRSNIVVVAYHWGVEYRNQPDARQKYLGHLSIDSGADLVIGNHPHWIQPVELYKNKLITYAHGNFVFDQEWSQKTKEGVVGRYTFYDNTLIDVEYLPLQIDNYGQPYFLEGDKKTNILKEMKTESFNLIATQ